MLIGSFGRSGMIEGVASPGLTLCFEFFESDFLFHNISTDRNIP